MKLHDLINDIEFPTTKRNSRKNKDFFFTNNIFFSKKNKLQQIKIFFSNFLLTHLKETKEIFIDGTFYFAPNEYLQLFTIILNFNNTYFITSCFFFFFFSKEQ